jgi:transcription elongation factor Elf1
MLKLMPIEHRDKFRCSFCGANKSVKYLNDIGKGIQVPCCNICALKNINSENEFLDDLHLEQFEQM